MYDDHNRLKESWGTYQKRVVTLLCQGISEGRREGLVAELRARAALVGGGDKVLLQRAIQQLEKGEV